MKRFTCITLLSLFLLACTSMPSTSKPFKPLLSTEIVILLHGLGRSDSAMWLLEDRLEGAGYTVFTLDYDSFQQSPRQVLDSVFQAL